jgi:impB/mucB/samB family
VIAVCRHCGVLVTSPIGRDRCDPWACRAKSTMPRFTHCRSPTSIAMPFTSWSKNAGSRSCRSPSNCRWRQVQPRACLRLRGAALCMRSAMPMFKALAACPDAEVIRPGHGEIQRDGRVVRAEMLLLTPLVEAVSIDEAFLDPGGTRKLHGACPGSSWLHSPGGSKAGLPSPCRSD